MRPGLRSSALESDLLSPEEMATSYSPHPSEVVSIRLVKVKEPKQSCYSKSIFDKHSEKLKSA